MPATEREVAAATLAALPGASANRLLRLWNDHGDPIAALAAVLEGRTADPTWARFQDHRTWPRWACPDLVEQHLHRRGARVFLPGDPDWPIVQTINNPPALLFAEGECHEAFHRGAISIVGTRQASPHGLADAHELATFVVEAGYTVVSGLAIGIDGAAHRGAIAAHGLTIGVVATGLDVVYPRRHTDLFANVRDQGLVVGEYPYGTPPDAWRFPVRNRIIAALSAVCVVVEAQATGGALITAQLAADMGKPVLAMPGSRRNAAAAGTNALLRDGATPLIDPHDLFVAIEASLAKLPAERSWKQELPIMLSPRAEIVLAACNGDAATIEHLSAATQLPPAEVAGALRELERVHKVERKHGKYWPR